MRRQQQAGGIVCNLNGGEVQWVQWGKRKEKKYDTGIAKKRFLKSVRYCKNPGARGSYSFYFVFLPFLLPFPVFSFLWQP